MFKVFAGMMVFIGLVFFSGCMSTPMPTPAPTLVPTPTVSPTPTPTPVPPTPTPTPPPLSQAEMERQYCAGLAKRPPSARAPVVFCGESLPTRPTGPVEGNTQSSLTPVTEEQIRQFCQSGSEQMQVCSTVIQQYGGNIQAYCLNAALNQLGAQACKQFGFFSKEVTPQTQKARLLFCDDQWRKENQGGRELNEGERKICNK